MSRELIQFEVLGYHAHGYEFSLYRQTGPSKKPFYHLRLSGPENFVLLWFGENLKRLQDQMNARLDAMKKP